MSRFPVRKNFYCSRLDNRELKALVKRLAATEAELLRQALKLLFGHHKEQK